MEPLTIEAMRAMLTARGFTWSDDELEAIRPLVERSLATLQKLEELTLGDVEPSAQYRVL